MAQPHNASGAQDDSHPIPKNTTPKTSGSSLGALAKGLVSGLFGVEREVDSIAAKAEHNIKHSLNTSAGSSTAGLGGSSGAQDDSHDRRVTPAETPVKPHHTTTVHSVSSGMMQPEDGTHPPAGYKPPVKPHHTTTVHSVSSGMMQPEDGTHPPLGYNPLTETPVNPTILQQYTQPTADNKNQEG